MRRRDLIKVIASTVSLWPFRARAIGRSLARIGFLPLGSPSNQYDMSYVEAFRGGLTDNGLIEGRNVTLDTVWVTNEPQYDQAVIELVRQGARVLVPAGSSATAAAKRQTSTVPIIFIAVGDPVRIGVVESLSHPGGNATGFTDVLADLSSKLVDLASDLVARGASIGYIWYDKWPDGHNRLAATERAAKVAGVMLRPRVISEAMELGAIVSDMRSNGTTIIIVQPSPFTYRHRNRIIEFLTNQGLGTICAWPPGPREGALIGYGPDYADIYRRAGSYILRILNGENPADLPVQNPVRFQLVINQDTASALNLNVPAALLMSAHEVIQK